MKNKIRVLKVPVRRAKPRIGRLTLPRAKRAASAERADELGQLEGTEPRGRTERKHGG